MMRAILGVALAALLCGEALAQEAQVSPGVQSVNGLTGAVTVTPGNFLGNTFTVSTLPTCNASVNGYIAYATDLGGGANNVKCVAGNWQHLTLGVPATVSQTSGTYTVTPLSTAPVLNMTGTILTSLLVQVQTAGLYPGYMLYVIKPGVLSGTLSVQLSTGGASLPILGSSKNAFIYDGTQLVQVQ